MYCALQSGRLNIEQSDLYFNCQKKRGIAKLTFVCEEAPKSAPSGVDEPGFRMVGTNGV